MDTLNAYAEHVHLGQSCEIVLCQTVTALNLTAIASAIHL